MAKLRAKKEEKSEELVVSQVEADRDELAGREEVKELVEASVETEVHIKSEANPASDKEIAEAEELKVLDAVTQVETNKLVEKPVVTEAPKKGNPNVRVKPNQDIRTYVGDSWYTLKKGKQETVPQNVKDILQKAGLLDAL